MKPIPVILDTDIGDDIDDTWALALLLKSPELEVKLVAADTVLIADNCGPLIREMYQKLEAAGWFEVRRRNNPYSMENFEYLYDAAMQWYENDDPPFRTRHAREVAVESCDRGRNSRGRGCYVVPETVSAGLAVAGVILHLYLHGVLSI